MSGRPILCHCGECDLCKRRAYQREWRERNPGYHERYNRRWNDARDPRRIERRESREQSERFTEEEDALLGTMPDVAVAQQIGRTAHAVWKRRRRLGVPGFRKRGGRYLRKGGYVVVTIESDDPLAEMARKFGAGRRVQEHRLVMARHLGRPLANDEIVHHRNGVKDDNRIENLELWTRSHPDGHRVVDAIRHAREILARYGEEFE